jgi:glycosyltransferase involved in cell wall biosynthesis
MKFAIVVHGRFHAFDLAKALLQQGHEVTVFTNYPAWAARKFGLPEHAIRGFWLHLVLYKLLYKFSNSGLRWDTSAFLNHVFGKWVAKQVAKGSFDVVHCFSGVAVELLASRSGRPGDHGRTIHLIVRGSAHIAVQDALLQEEELRSKLKIERPSTTIMERERKEYDTADRIVTLSTFAFNSFVSQGIPPARLALLRLGVDVSRFVATPEMLEARYRRIASGASLRVLWVGTMSLRKGLMDYIEIVKALAGENFEFRFVGTVPGDLRSLASQLSSSVELIPKQPHWELRQQYGWGDVFIFPTIEDGFAVVLAQAAANGLPILATTNCAAPDMIGENTTGWVLPIRSPGAFIERLRWCDRNREAMVTMARRVSEEFVPRTWDDVGRDFTELCQNTIRSVTANSVAQGHPQ